MERRRKEQMIAYFEAPKPERKQAFIRRMGVPRIDITRLVIMQARYISKWVWISSVLLCGMTYAITFFMEEKYVSAIIALIPFLVMFSVTESMRSYRYKMEELELSTRFSLKSIVMARMLMLGIGNLLVLVIVTVLLENRVELHMLHVLTPYFLTAGGGLYIVRKISGNESVFFCFLLAMVVSALRVWLPWRFSAILLPQFVPIWALVCILAMLITARESYRTIRMTEDLIWN